MCVLGAPNAYHHHKDTCYESNFQASHASIIIEEIVREGYIKDN